MSLFGIRIPQLSQISEGCCCAQDKLSRERDFSNGGYFGSEGEIAEQNRNGFDAHRVSTSWLRSVSQCSALISFPRSLINIIITNRSALISQSIKHVNHIGLFAHTTLLCFLFLQIYHSFKDFFNGSQDELVLNVFASGILVLIFFVALCFPLIGFGVPRHPGQERCMN